MCIHLDVYSVCPPLQQTVCNPFIMTNNWNWNVLTESPQFGPNVNFC